MSDAEKQRHEEIIQIQQYLAQGYSPTHICTLLHTTYKRIRKYAIGAPKLLCRYDTPGRTSKFEKYQGEIIALLKQNLQLKDILAHIHTLGLMGKYSAFCEYCHKLIREQGITYTPKNNSLGVPIKNEIKTDVHYVTKQDILKYLWSGKELSESDVNYIFEKYPCLNEMKNCIEDFRKIYVGKSTTLLDEFIQTYSKSTNKNLASFAQGLTQDKDAVTNSVTSSYSNGFVEGNNNKVKAIKRSMYGRAKIKLLSAKVLYG